MGSRTLRSSAPSHQVSVRNLVRKSRSQLMHLSVDLLASRRGGTHTMATQCMVHDPPLDGDFLMSADTVEGDSGHERRIALRIKLVRALPVREEHRGQRTALSETFSRDGLGNRPGLHCVRPVRS